LLTEAASSEETDFPIGLVIRLGSLLPPGPTVLQEDLNSTSKESYVSDTAASAIKESGVHTVMFVAAVLVILMLLKIVRAYELSVQRRSDQ